MGSKSIAGGATGIIPVRPRSLWQNRDYLLLWSGQTVSSFGTQASQLAFPLLVLTLTHSPVQAGLIGGLRLVPYIFLSLPAGAWVDRVDRKRLMIICDAIRALALGSIPLAFLLGHLTLVQLYITSLIEGSLYVLFSVAETSCLPHVVPKEQLPTALGQNQAAEGAASLLGPTIGGAIFSLNTLLPFLADAISYVVSVTSLCFIRSSFQKQTVSTKRKLSGDVLVGLKWLWQQPLLRYIALRNGGITFSYAGTSLLVIVLAQRQHASSAGIGVILAVGGIGHIFGSFVGPYIQKRFSFGKIVTTLTWAYLVWWSLYLFAFTPILLGVVTVVLSINRPIQNVVNASYRLLIVPDEMRGRVSSVNQLISWCMIPLGGLVTGTLLQLVGPTLTILFFSTTFLLLAILTTFNPHVRNAPSWAQLQQEYQVRKAAKDPHSQVEDEAFFEEKWAGIASYLLGLPDRNRGQQKTHEVYVYQSYSNWWYTEYIPARDKWEGIDDYLVRLPDRMSHRQKVYAAADAALKEMNRQSDR